MSPGTTLETETALVSLNGINHLVVLIHSFIHLHSMDPYMVGKTSGYRNNQGQQDKSHQLHKCKIYMISHNKQITQTLK
jgi:hypothetical protein